MAASGTGWLRTTIDAVREVMLRRLEKSALDADAEKDVQMAIEELDVMWEELQAQADALSRENVRYAEFFENAPDAYLITDAGGNVREANRAAAELHGAAGDEVVGSPLSQYVAERDRVRFLSGFVGMFVDPHVSYVNWECALRAAGGTERAASISVRAIPLKKSGVRGLCWLIRPL